jgi:phosphatidylserine decarboxylase
VINLFAAGQITFMPSLSNGTVTRMGAPFAEALRQHTPVKNDTVGIAKSEPVVADDIIASTEAAPSPVGMAQAGVTKPAAPPEEI